MDIADLLTNDGPVVEEELPVEKRKRYSLFKDFLPDLYERKKNILRMDPDAEKDFAPFIINRAVSMNYDTVLWANEMNKANCATKQMVYDFYCYGLRAGRRYSKWAKKENDDDVAFICEAFSYNKKKAEAALKLISQEELNELRRKFDTGGIVRDNAKK